MPAACSAVHFHATEFKRASEFTITFHLSLKHHAAHLDTAGFPHFMEIRE
jgi:hypothetical protein